jgi:hypothetical protein
MMIKLKSSPNLINIIYEFEFVYACVFMGHALCTWFAHRCDVYYIKQLYTRQLQHWHTYLGTPYWHIGQIDIEYKGFLFLG